MIVDVTLKDRLKTSKVTCKDISMLPDGNLAALPLSQTYRQGTGLWGPPGDPPRDPVPLKL